MEKEKIQNLMKKIADKTAYPNNSHHQYQMNRDFAFCEGVLRERAGFGDADLEEIERDYLTPLTI